METKTPSSAKAMAAEAKPKLLLHVCCAVCGAYLTEILKKNFEPVVFFYNPNIHPEEEYQKRKISAQKLAEIYKIEFIEGNYDTDNWFEKVKGFEKEPEGGARCPICFRMRLKETAEIAKKKNIGFFTTTLAMSPYKSEAIIDQLGEDIAKNLSINFIKVTDLFRSKSASNNLNENSGGSASGGKEIWQKTRTMAKEFNFYHQKYCGCVFGREQQDAKKSADLIRKII